MSTPASNRPLPCHEPQETLTTARLDDDVCRGHAAADIDWWCPSGASTLPFDICSTGAADGTSTKQLSKREIECTRTVVPGETIAVTVVALVVSCCFSWLANVDWRALGNRRMAANKAERMLWLRHLCLDPCIVFHELNQPQARSDWDCPPTTSRPQESFSLPDNSPVNRHRPPPGPRGPAHRSDDPNKKSIAQRQQPSGRGKPPFKESTQ